jgi:Protein of unknown function (DUF3828)
MAERNRPVMRRIGCMRYFPGLALLLPLVLSAAAPPPASDPAEVIRQLYRDHQPWKGKRVEYNDPAVAARYFDDSLIALFGKDREQSERNKDLPCLDFDPILQAQDFDEAGITEPRIRAVPRGKDVAYEVTFTGRSKEWKNWSVRAIYLLERTRNGWRVHDIEFPKGGSLRKTLACWSN